jgi:hypothetical protein
MTDTLFTLLLQGATFFCAPEPFIDAQIKRNIECEIWRTQTEICEQRIQLRDEAIAERDTALMIERDNKETWKAIAGLYQQASEVRHNEIKQLRKAYRRERLKSLTVPLVVAPVAFFGGYFLGKYVR